MISEKDLIQQLKTLRNTPEGGLADAQTKERIFKVVMSQIRPETRKLGFLTPFSAFSYFVPPKFVYAMGIIAFLITSGTVASASRNALPGDTLYSAKLAVEKAQVRFTSNPARRAVIQMELAGNRLKEVQQIKEEGGVLNGRAGDALSRFTKDMTEVNGVLKQAGDPEQVKTATNEIAQKVEEYKQELANLVKEKQEVENKDSSGFIVPPEKKQVRNVDLAAIAKAEEALQGVGAVDNNIEEVKPVEEKSAELEDGEVGL